MILIADSGSTKTEWALIKDNSISYYTTDGINPRQHSIETINQTLFQLDDQIKNESVTEIFFYGAGCGSDSSSEKMTQILQSFFPNAKTLVDTDLVGAAKAMFGAQSGIIGILGTGANCGLWDGSKIASQPLSLGYLLGDEGSGYYIGKLLIEYYLKGNTPDDVAKAIEKWSNHTPQSIISELYSSEKPNRFLAQFAKFAHEHKQLPFIDSLLTENFTCFFRDYVSKIDGYQTRTIKLIGSVAYYFETELKNCAWQFGSNIGAVEQSIIKRLALDHRKS